MPRNLTELEFRDECCTLPLTFPTTIFDLLPNTHRYTYLRLMDMLPLEFHEHYPDLWKTNPYCTAETVHLLRNRKKMMFEKEHVHRPVTYERIMPDQTPILDRAIDIYAQATGKTVRFIEERTCYPYYRMPLEQVSLVVLENSISCNSILFI